MVMLIFLARARRYVRGANMEDRTNDENSIPDDENSKKLLNKNPGTFLRNLWRFIVNIKTIIQKLNNGKTNNPLT